MTKLCECGCGQPTPVAGQTRTDLGWIRGQPIRFVHGHHLGGNQHALRHGASYTPEHKAYDSAMRRCANPKHPRWADYGGRGIKFLFTSFQQWLDELGPRPSTQHSVDRIDNNRHYEPGNMRWATRSQQNRNRRPDLQSISMTDETFHRLISDLTYFNYRHNRRLTPETMPEQWALLYGPQTEAMEARFQKEQL